MTISRVLDAHGVCYVQSDKTVLQGIALYLYAGEIGYLLGPSGCGKTTLLRILAGFIRPDCGTITIDGNVVHDTHSKTTIPPEKRQVGMVFQDNTLFPHLTVFENAAFGLSALPASSQRTRITRLLSLVDMAGSNDRYPHELSGGQQQRIALVRAIAPHPKLLLLDEPFNGLDVLLKEQLLDALVTVLRNECITTLAVTHDRSEAFTAADRVGVMTDGTVAQWDSPYHVYHEPTHPFVAAFIGDSVLIDAVVCDARTVDTVFGLIYGHFSDFSPRATVRLLVRPSDILFDEKGTYAGTLVGKRFRGDQFLYTVCLDDGNTVPCLSDGHENHAVGSRIRFRINFEHAVVYPQQSVE